MMPCCLAMTLIFGGFFMLTKTLLALISGTKHRPKSWQRPRLHHAVPAKH